PEVDEVPGDQQGQDARCRGAGDAAGVGGAGRADEGAQEHGDGEAEEGDEDDGVEVEDGPFLVEEPGEVAGRDAAGDGARAPVAAEEPAPQDVEDGEAAHPPQHRGADRQDLAGALLGRVGRAAVGAGGRGLVEVGDGAAGDQPAPRVGLVGVRRGQADVELVDLGLVVPQAAPPVGEQPGPVAVAAVLDRPVAVVAAAAVGGGEDPAGPGHDVGDDG